jgi:hypothetical protein
MTSSPEKYNRIKNWLIGYGKFVINEREDDNFHFSFLILPNKQEHDMIPLTVASLKGVYSGKECILVGVGWSVDKKSEVVNAVLKDPTKTRNLVSGLKQVINSRKYSLKFMPDEQNISSIRITRIYPIDWLDKDSLLKEIMNVWAQFGNILNQFQKVSGMSNPSDYV